VLLQPSIKAGLEEKHVVLLLIRPSLPMVVGKEGARTKYQEFLAAKASALRFARPSITAANEPLVLTSLLNVER
jgi:hypothetical protein